MKWSTSVSLMFREHPIAQRLQAARDAGFDGVEIQVLGESSADDWVNARQAAGIDVALVNVGMGDFLSGGPGLSGVPDREAEFRIEAEHTLNTARRLACCNVHVGPSRIPVGQTRAACLEVLVANLEWLRPKADEAGVRLLLEPLNRQETPNVLLGTVDEAVGLISERLQGRVGLQFDVYHVVLNGEDPVVALKRVLPQVWHVQFSDVPGRKAPGLGSIDFVSFFQTLKQSGYSGWCGAEYFAMSDTTSTLAWLPQFKALA